MKIVWLSHSEGLAAGAELCLWEGTRGLVSSGHDLHVIAPARGRLAERLTDSNVPVTVIPYRWWMHSRLRLPLKRLYQNVVAAKRIAELFRQLRPDVAISNTLTIPSGAWAARQAGIPHVWYIHEFGREDHGLKFDLGKRLSLGMVSRLSDAVIVNSHAVRRKFSTAIKASRLHVIYYAVDFAIPPAAVELQEDPFRLCLIGRICAGKGQEDALRAVGRLREKGIGAYLSLVGNENADYGRFLRRLAKDLAIESQVAFVAFTEDPFAIMTRSHAALMCSRSEAFGRVTVEAMKLGKPVVGVDRGATSELIHDGKTGLLYPPGDAEALSRKIELLVRDRSLLKALGENAREWSHRTCSLETYTAALYGILKKALDARSESLRETRQTIP